MGREVEVGEELGAFQSNDSWVVGEWDVCFRPVSRLERGTRYKAEG